MDWYRYALIDVDMRPAPTVQLGYRLARHDVVGSLREYVYAASARQQMSAKVLAEVDWCMATNPSASRHFGTSSHMRIKYG